MKRVFLGLVSVLAVVVASTNSVRTAGPPPAAPAAVPTFSKDVAPIVFNHCTSCHRPGEVAPMSLLSYDDVRPWARAIKSKVVAREMPPWGADPAQTLKMRNDPSLSKEQIDTIVAWVDGGAPRGNDAEMPAPPTYTTGWTHGSEPDAVLEMPVEFDIPAEGELGVQMFYSPVPFKEDRFAEVVELRPGNRGVVHHAGIFLVDIPEGTRIVDGRLIGEDGKVIGDRGAAGLPRTEGMGLPGSSKLLSWVPGRGVDQHRRYRRQAHPRRQVHQLAGALQPHRQAGEGSHAARSVVQQEAGHTRSADPSGRRCAGDDEERLVALSRGRQGSRLLRRRQQHASPRADAKHSAVRRELGAHRHHARDRADHALRDVAAHASARQEPEVGDHVSRTAASR